MFEQQIPSLKGSWKGTELCTLNV